MKKSLIASLCAICFLTACADNQQNNTLAGTGIGAAVGAGVGNLISKNSKGTAIGAGVGALLGGAVGYQFGSKIRQALTGIPAESGVTVADAQPNQPNSPIIITVPEKVMFESGSSYLKNDPFTQNTLSKISQAIQSQNYSQVLVIGHADRTGTPAKNQQLSQDRASSVGGYLARTGVDSRRVRAEGHGSNEPVADNATVSGRAQNRRVEIVVYPA